MSTVTLPDLQNGNKFTLYFYKQGTKQEIGVPVKHLVQTVRWPHIGPKPLRLEFAETTDHAVRSFLKSLYGERVDIVLDEEGTEGVLKLFGHSIHSVESLYTSELCAALLLRVEFFEKTWN